MTAGAKIMIVDNAADVDSLWKYAQTTPDAIFLVSGGISAQRRLKQINYEIDAVVTDLVLDDLDGVTLTEIIRRNEKIREIDCCCLIFWYTDYPVNETLRSLQTKYDVTEIFTKPTDPIQIIEKVKAYLAIQDKLSA